jgi:hypothetical protein
MTPKEMKAAVVHKFGKPLSIEEVPVPRPGPGRFWSGWSPVAWVTPTSTLPTVIGP